MSESIILFFKSSPYGKGANYFMLVDSLFYTNINFLRILRKCVMCVTPATPMLMLRYGKKHKQMICTQN